MTTDLTRRDSTAVLILMGKGEVLVQRHRHAAAARAHRKQPSTGAEDQEEAAAAPAVPQGYQRLDADNRSHTALGDVT